MAQRGPSGVLNCGPRLPSPPGRGRVAGAGPSPRTRGGTETATAGARGSRRGAGPSHARPPPHTCGTHSIARLGAGSRYSATWCRNVIIKLRGASRGKSASASLGGYIERRVCKAKAGQVAEGRWRGMSAAGRVGRH